MEWNRIAYVQPNTPVFDLRTTHAGVVMRGVDRVVGWNGVGGDLGWSLDLPNHSMFRCSQLADVGSRFATVEDPGHGAAVLIGFDADGAVAWRSPVGVTVQDRGLAAGCGHFWVLGMAPSKQTELVCVHAATGKVVDRFRVRADQIAGNDSGVALAWRDGLWWSGGGAPECVFDGRNVSDLLVHGGDIDFAFEDADADFAPSVGRLDTRRQQVVGRVASPVDVEQGPCAPVHRFGRITVVALSGEAGLAGVDIEDGRIAWRAHQAAKREIRGGAGLDEVFVACTSVVGELVAVDRLGQVVNPPPTEARDVGFVFRHGGELVVGGARLTERFRCVP